MILSFNFTLNAAGVARWAQMATAARTTALRAGVTSAALLVENDARPLAPYLTGTLRRSIRTELMQESETKMIAHVGSSEPYARRMELGFVGTDSLGRRYNQAPRPYLRPALDMNKDNIVREVGQAIAEIIK